MTKSKAFMLLACLIGGFIYLWMQYQDGLMSEFLAGSADLKLKEARFIGQGREARLSDVESLKYLAGQRKTLSSKSISRRDGLLYQLKVYSSLGRIGTLGVGVHTLESQKEAYGWNIHYPRGFMDEDGLLYCDIDPDAPIKLKECMRFLMDPQKRYKMWPE